MSFIYPVTIQQEVDIDELITKWNTDPNVVNPLSRNLTIGEYALINLIVAEGLNDILGQQIAPDNPIEDDPFAKPNPDYGIMPPIYEDDDPYATPKVEVEL